MGIIKGYNLQGLDIDKKSLFTLSFKREKSENRNFNNYFKQVKEYLSSSADFNINNDSISEITLAKKDTHLLHNNKNINFSCLWNSFDAKRISPYLFDIKSNNFIIIHKNNSQIFSDPNQFVPQPNDSNNAIMNFGSLSAIKNMITPNDNQVDHSKSLAAILYHEIGHFIHFKWQNIHQKNAPTDTMEGITVSALTRYTPMLNGITDAMLLSNKEYTRKYHSANNFNERTLFDKIYSESFADNFALMMTERLLPNEDSVKTKDAILNQRIKEERENSNHYNTVSSMNAYLSQKQSFENIDLSKSIEKLIDISTKHTFSYTLDLLNKETNKLVEYTSNIAEDNEPLVNANNIEIKDHLNMLYYLGGLHNPDSEYEKINLLDISRNLKTTMGLDNLISFYALKNVQFVNARDNEYLQKEFMYGAAKKYSMERLSGNENIILKSTKEENIEYINNRMMDLNFMNLVESDIFKGGLILRENKIRIDSILDKMISQKMMTQNEVDEYKNDEHKEYTSFVKHIMESEEKVTSMIRIHEQNNVKPKETFKSKLKQRLNQIRIVSNNKEQHVSAYKNKPL